LNSHVFVGEVERGMALDYSELLRAGAGAASDANGKRGALNEALRPMTRHHRFAGRAVTVLCEPNDNLVPYAALPYLKAGDVAVIATGGCGATTALLGGIITGHMRNIGVAGIVTDGLVRDIDEIEQLGIPLFAAGVISSAPTKHGSGAIGLPVMIGGTLVRTGDAIVADRDGVTAIPMEQVQAAVDGLSAIYAKEAGASAVIKTGALEPAWLGELRRDISFVKVG
jgi:4-hydroxy-4-methyl-2-oxoglutarate aldolase